MTRPQLKALLTALVMAVCLLTYKAVAADPPAASGMHFTILHTNDLHAHDEPFTDHGRNVGGIARIAHLIRAIKAKNPNVLTIDAGDIFQGTPFFKFYHGKVEVEMLNAAGYDLYTIGNHEFDEGSENLAKQLQQAHFQVISSNIDASAYPPLAALIKPSVVKVIDGQKVGFVGAVVPNLTEISLTTGGVKVKSAGAQWFEPIEAEVAKLQAEGVNKIILVTHAGVDNDKQLATIPGVDAIVGGHSHTRLDSPIIIDRPDGSKCIIVQTGCYGKALGKLDLAFDAQGRLDLPQTHYHLIDITDSIHEEPDMKAYLQEKAQPFAKERTTVVATAGGVFDNSFRHYPCDSSLGDLIADAMAEAGSKYGATISLQNRGGIRAALEAGPVTEEEVDEILPFENHLLVASVSGEKLLKALENSIAAETFGGKFLDVHGIKFAFDKSKPPFHRVLWALAQDKDGSWHSISEHGTYRIAINSYSFNSGEGYDFAGATDVKDTGERLSKFLVDYLHSHKSITPQLPSRIVALNGNLAQEQTDGRAGAGGSSSEELVVKSSSPGDRVWLVRGFGRDVSALQGLQGRQVAVPVKQPKVVAIRTVSQGQREIHLKMPRAAASENSEYLVVVVPRKKSAVVQISLPVEVHH